MNRMCLSCECLNKDCAGTNCNVWTGCVWRKPIKNSQPLCSVIPVMSRYEMEERGVLIDKIKEVY